LFELQRHCMYLYHNFLSSLNEKCDLHLLKKVHVFFLDFRYPSVMRFFYGTQYDLYDRLKKTCM
jgi:hypothetical protein